MPPYFIGADTRTAGMLRTIPIFPKSLFEKKLEIDLESSRLIGVAVKGHRVI